MAGTVKQRDWVQQIKDSGQSIIDNAESIYGTEKYKTGIKITVEISFDSVPEITVERSYIPRKSIETFSTKK